MNDDNPPDGSPESEPGFDQVRDALDTLFVSGDPDEAFEDAEAARVQECLRNSERARQYFNRLARADRALNGHRRDADAAPASDEPQDSDGASRPGAASRAPRHGAPPGQFERNFGDAAFSAALDDMLAEENARDPGSTGGSEPGDSGGDVITLFGQNATTLGLAAAAVAAIGFGVVLMNSTDSGAPADSADQKDDGEFRARSAAPPNQNTFRSPELEVFCARRGDDGVTFEGTDTPSPGPLSCPIDAELKLTYRNHERQLDHAAFFGVDANGTIYWYGPTPAVPEPVEVAVSPEPEPVGETIRLAVNHQPGRLRVHAVFATEPIDFSTLEARLTARRGPELFGADSLEFRDYRTASTSKVIRLDEAQDGSEGQ